MERLSRLTRSLDLLFRAIPDLARQLPWSEYFETVCFLLARSNLRTGHRQSGAEARHKRVVFPVETDILGL